MSIQVLTLNIKINSTVCLLNVKQIGVQNSLLWGRLNKLIICAENGKLGTWRNFTDPLIKGDKIGHWTIFAMVFIPLLQEIPINYLHPKGKKSCTFEVDVLLCMHEY